MRSFSRVAATAAAAFALAGMGLGTASASTATGTPVPAGSYQLNNLDDTAYTTQPVSSPGGGVWALDDVQIGFSNLQATGDSYTGNLTFTGTSTSLPGANQPAGSGAALPFQITSRLTGSIAVTFDSTEAPLTGVQPTLTEPPGGAYIGNEQIMEHLFSGDAVITNFSTGAYSFTYVDGQGETLVENSTNCATATACGNITGLGKWLSKVVLKAHTHRGRTYARAVVYAKNAADLWVPSADRSVYFQTSNHRYATGSLITGARGSTATRELPKAFVPGNFVAIVRASKSDQRAVS